MSLIPICEIQGEGLHSPLNRQQVRTSGVVTGVLRKGFFLQTADVIWDGKRSNGLFVYTREVSVPKGAYVEVTGEVVDFLKHDTAKPCTQLHLDAIEIRSTQGPDIVAVEVTQKSLELENGDLARYLNSLEGMLVSISAGQTFIAPSNVHGDYVLALDKPECDSSVVRTEIGGAIAASSNPDRWFPGFRVTNYNHAPRLNLGAILTSKIAGPLNYRADAYQISVEEPFTLNEQFISHQKSSVTPSEKAITIMTLNCFNLDPNVEAESRVMNPRRDVDDDWGEGRFHTLAQAIVLQANTPDIIALQEIQDNDGAEITEIVDASETYALLIKTIEQLSGVRYNWVDVAPELGMDGGQPGGNIRNAYLYNPSRVTLDDDSVRVIGQSAACFLDSRKPLVAEFIEKSSEKRLAIINVHLASKRHQESIFAPINPGVDAKASVRIKQAHLVREEATRILKNNVPFYITGDFNDTEHSETLLALCGDDFVNLVLSLAESERYDYNHRGKLQVLMHGIVPADTAKNSGAQYEIIHGNELMGVKPGESSDKPSDHAYVIAKLPLS